MTTTSPSPPPRWGALIDQGVGRFSHLTLGRRSVDSVQIARGCVDLIMAAAIDRPVAFEGR